MITSSDDQSWKIFQRDTQAGRLLSRLYGCSPISQRVSYPKPRRRRSVEVDSGNQPKLTQADASKGWKTTYTVHSLSKAEEAEKENERKKNISRALSVRVPKVGRNKSGQRDRNCAAKVDQIPHRKTENGCKSTVEEVKFLNKKYRPPVSHAYSSDAEKKRLNDLFSGGGGKCLPKDLTNLPGHAASRETESGCKSRELPDTLFDQIYYEIKERREHQMEMERLGAGDETRQSTVSEIQTRLTQLRKIDPNKAAAVIKMLMN